MGRSSIGTRAAVEATNDELVDFMAQSLGTLIFFAPGQQFCRRTVEDPWVECSIIMTWVLHDHAEQFRYFGHEPTTMLRNMGNVGRSRELLVRLRDQQRFRGTPWPTDLDHPLNPANHRIV